LTSLAPSADERAVILAPRGRDAMVAQNILREAGIRGDICRHTDDLLAEVVRGAECAIVTEEAMASAGSRDLVQWVTSQPPWSDFPFIVLTRHGGGLERNPAAAFLTERLGNVSFLERPFHPTTLVSVVQTALRGRRRQYECRRLNEELESRVAERTAELAAANRQLLAQIEERERVEATLRQMQRLEAVGQLTSGVAHDFNNLLTVVLGNIAFVERDLKAAGIDGKTRERLAYMRAAAERGAKLTDQLLSFSRRQRLEPKVVDLNDSIARMRDLLHSTIGGSIQIETALAGDLEPALVDPTQLELAVLNLAINARDAMPGGGTLRVLTENVAAGPPLSPEEPVAGEYVAVVVSDTGSGMNPEVRGKVFEPFFTTKEIGKGSGLGLSQVLGFAKQSGGGVRVDSAPGHGTRVHIYLPRAEAPVPAARPARVSSSNGARAHARILLVDDDSGVREVTAALLRGGGYTVVEAGSGGGALEIFDLEGTAIDLLLVDLAMPGMSGAELARQVRSKRPSLPILFVTGFADRAVLDGVSESEVVGKPFMDDELIDKVRMTLAAAAPT
jgi:signal transduction histidine kinase